MSTYYKEIEEGAFGRWNLIELCITDVWGVFKSLDESIIHHPETESVACGGKGL